VCLPVRRSDVNMQPNNARIGRVFLRWYFLQRPLAIARAYQDYAAAFGSMFSIVFLVKTLFAPWKSIRDAYPKKGFDVTAILQTLTLNVTARTIGCIIRLSALLFGLLLQGALFAGFSLYILLWVTFPVIAVFAIPFLFFVSF
jgi:hypothetical protein